MGPGRDACPSRHKRGIPGLFTNGERAGVHVAVTDDLVQQGVKAGDIANAVAALSGGKGGGRPHFASAGAGDPAKLPAARAATPSLISAWLTGGNGGGPGWATGSAPPPPAPPPPVPPPGRGTAPAPPPPHPSPP